jgi:C1A family cysteine protease
MMRISAILLISAAALIAAAAATAPTDGRSEKLWRDWKAAHNRNYRTRAAEDAKRAIFFENARIVDEWNSQVKVAEDDAKLALNDFADMSNEEYSNMLTFVVPERSREVPDLFQARRASRSARAAPVVLPTSLDYRQSGFVGPVGDQARCGSCWAFSAAGACSGAHAKAGHPFVDLSPQQLVDCSAGRYNFGCSGGDTVAGASYAVLSGLMSEAEYPYTAVAGQCLYRNTSIAHFTGIVELPAGNERVLAEALYQYGTLSVAVNASPESFQLYHEGVLRDRTCSPRALNHAMVLVGYTANSWILKNSWGIGWGQAGFIRIARNSGNMCGVASYSLAVIA